MFTKTFLYQPELQLVQLQVENVLKFVILCIYKKNYAVSPYAQTDFLYLYFNLRCPMEYWCEKA